MLEEWTGPHYDRLLRNINRQEKVTQDGHPRDFWIVILRLK
jgi:hypothetical protein